ncbi:hypothetical protein AVEN_170190-1 [Araneus ventricosus]|uniref:Uncharacterized protein n=1 Tax=Araneus ventricosus TaxID=182803 RepID=A0A4Y2CYH6_ARAVE|nr:hypothetical protein AVEN_170190-1 [Araneus ventricosus]
MSWGEMPECNADAEIMNIDPPDSNSTDVEQDGYQTQGHTGNNQGPTNAISLTKTPKIPPVTLEKPGNYRDLIKQINEKEGIKCNAKEAGEFVKLFCETPRDVRSLVDFLDENNKEYFVIPGRIFTNPTLIELRQEISQYHWLRGAVTSFSALARSVRQS